MYIKYTKLCIIKMQSMLLVYSNQNNNQEIKQYKKEALHTHSFNNK